MNSSDLKKLLDYIQENNSCEHMYQSLKKNRYCFKYIRIYYDTRENLENEEHVWWIQLDNGKNSKISLRDKSFEECKQILDLPREDIIKLFEREVKDNEN